MKTNQPIFGMRGKCVVLMALMLMPIAGCRDRAKEPTAPLTMELKSTSVVSGALGRAYTCDGQGLSPQLSWRNVPPNTRSLALVVTDLDSPFGFHFVHWVVYNIPPGTLDLPAGLPVQERLSGGAEQGPASNDKPGYSPPCPRRRSSHRYDFVLYALNSPVNVPSASKKHLFEAISGHVIAEGEMIGRYGR